MKKKSRFFLLGILFTITISVYAQPVVERWTEQKANERYGGQPRYCFFNYIPAYAINYTAMWDKTSFDGAAIDKELTLAEGAGMNVLRAVLRFVVYDDDPAYFLATLDTFMNICQRHKIKFMPALFDDCVFGLEHDPRVGRQPEPLKGWYAWAWSPSPGHSLVIDEQQHSRIEKYVKVVIGRFKNDPRILLWDLYNEPTNGGMGSASFPLLKKVITWARTVNPSQPVSIDVWNNDKRLNDIVIPASDVITFHNYADREGLVKQITELGQYNRPLICTEWMNRPNGSLVETNLPVFHDEKVGCLLWGLVNGKTQTDLPWGHRPGDPMPVMWQHDLYRSDFSPYRPEEITAIKKLVTDKGKENQSGK